MDSETRIYSPFEDHIELSEYDKLNSKTKIEEVLIYLHSFSNKFQIMTFLISIFYCFAMGLHVFTFVYMFLSPDFHAKGYPNKST
jgi:hypothetical protein